MKYTLRERNNAACRRYRARNPEKRRESLRKYRETNREKIRQQNAAYKQRNRERILAKERADAKKRYQKNPDKYRKAALEKNKNKPEYHREYNRKWGMTDKGRLVRERARISRRASMSSIIKTLSIEDWRNILNEYNFACAYCSRTDLPLTKDHVIPLSRGGHHTKENVVPACKPCNSRKGAKLITPW